MSGSLRERLASNDKVWSRKRGLKPYTALGIQRLKCVRCGAQAHAQWSICSDLNVQRPICTQCDIDLNRLVLEWMGCPDADQMMKKYVDKQVYG